LQQAWAPSADFREFSTGADVVMPRVSKGIYINDVTSGNSLEVVPSNSVDGAGVILDNLIVGVVYPFSIREIKTAGSTVDSVFVLF
jgi:hypothetical protein